MKPAAIILVVHVLVLWIAARRLSLVHCERLRDGVLVAVVAAALGSATLGVWQVPSLLVEWSSSLGGLGFFRPFVWLGWAFSLKIAILHLADRLVPGYHMDTFAVTVSIAFLLALSELVVWGLFFGVLRLPELGT